MAEPIYEFRFQRGTADRWTALNPVLGPGEPGVEIDTGLFKIGDGSTEWNALEYFLNEFYVTGLIEVAIAASGGLSSDPRIGDMEDLTTASQDLLVNAINEVKLIAEEGLIRELPFGRNGNLITFTGPKLYFNDDLRLIGEIFSLTTPPTGSSAIFEILKNGSPVYSIRPAIAPSSNASAPGTLAGPTLFVARTDSFQVQCVQIGSSIPGAELSVLAKMLPA